MAIIGLLCIWLLGLPVSISRSELCLTHMSGNQQGPHRGQVLRDHLNEGEYSGVLPLLAPWPALVKSLRQPLGLLMPTAHHSWQPLLPPERFHIQLASPVFPKARVICA